MWDHFSDLITTRTDIAIQVPVLLQHFYMGLSKDCVQSLDQASRGPFLHLSASEARSILDRISGKTPCTSIHDELPEEEKTSSPEQEEKVLIVKSQPLQSHGLAINLKPSIPQNPPRKEEIPPLESPDEIKDDLFYADFEKSLNFLLHKRSSSEYNLNPLKKGSLKKAY